MPDGASLFSLLFSKKARAVQTFNDFVETEEYEKGFSKHYKENLLPLITGYEEKRVAAFNQARRSLFFFLPVFILIPFLTYGVWVFWDFHEDVIEFTSWIALSVYAASYLYIKKSIRLYRSSIKTEIFPKIVGFIEGFSYEPEYNYDVRKYEKYDILPSYDLEVCEDHIRGTYKGLEIELVEASLQKRKVFRRSKLDTKEVFSGLLIKLNVAKNFKGKTIITADGGFVKNFFNEMGQELEYIKLEDPEFENVFEVYSDDQVDARYLLTTSFMERLIDIRKVFNSDTMKCSFFDRSLFMAVPLEKNMFEPGPINKPEDFIDDAKSLLKEIQAIFEISDTLKLDMDIGT